MNILEIKNCSVNFGGIKALDNVSLNFEKNKITSILGPNGAGKTTLFNVISGIINPGDGDIIFNDKSIIKLNDFERAQIGIGRTFQDIRLFKSLTVFENILIGAMGNQSHLSIFSSLFKKRDAKSYIKKNSNDAIKFTGIENIKDKVSEDLSLGSKKETAFARTLASKPIVILLDEIASGLNMDETIRFSKMIKLLPAMGITPILIEHNIKMVMDISDKIAVLNHGKLIAYNIPEKIKSDRHVIDSYLGSNDA